MEDDTTYDVAVVLRFTVRADGMVAAAGEASRWLNVLRGDPDRLVRVTDVRIHRSGGPPPPIFEVG